jgi:glycosyltransferase involved in cell wall biosynthesis
LIDVYMLPETAELGIGRVVEAYKKHLPNYGVRFVDSWENADLVAVHAGCQITDKEGNVLRQPDIHHCHGLYPTATVDDNDMYYQFNAPVIENLRTAKLVTVPSEWVAGIMQRDMLFSPEVVRHGIDVEDWPLSKSNGGYILWAKGHNPGVCDPSVLNALAERLPANQFVTIDGKPADNVQVIGKQPFGKMKKLLQNAGVYLAVTKETFGIQTLEAMALGKPVVGYAWGGTASIITNGQDGWLVEPGDIDGLVEGVEWALANAEDLGANARETVIARYSWSEVCKRLAGLYEQVLHNHHNGPKVSVIIPCYNYGHRVGDAIESVLAQDFDGDFEIIVVNDASTDGSEEAISKYDGKVTHITHRENKGVAEARNCGIRHAKGEYIACLDSDDRMYTDFLKTLVPALDADRGIGIAYGGLDMVYDEGRRKRKSDWPPEFCYRRQAIRMNQVPSACLFRRELWGRAGGYRAIYTPAEDGELWLRMTSLGGDAVRVTEDSLYEYEAHADSLSRTMAEPDYVADKPWSRDITLTPFAASACEYLHESFPVRNYDEPWVSIIIPVGPGHGELVDRAIDSVYMQSLPYWELIVVNDSGEEIVQQSTGRPIEEAYPFIKLLETDARNVSVARNLGAQHAKADLLCFLDADDKLMCDYSLETVRAFNEDGEAYVYTDYLSHNYDREKRHGRDFSCEDLKNELIHPVTALVPRAWHDEIGGFDEELGTKGYEDWDYYLRMVLQGQHCGVRLDIPLVVYDVTTGLRREDCEANKDELVSIIQKRWMNMTCRRCPKGRVAGSSSTPPIQPAALMGLPEPLAAVAAINRVRRNPVVEMPKTRKAMRRGRGVPLPPSNSQQEITEMDKQGSVNDVLVRENSGNKGMHNVRGMATRRRYGRKRHGQEFMMDLRDQEVMPHQFIIVQEVSHGIPEKPKAPAVKVSRPPAVAISRPPAPDLQLPPAPEPEEELEAYDVDAAGIDISILTLAQIKRLRLSPMESAEAYESEAMDRARKTVLAYLEGEAGDLLEFEEDEEE